MSKNNIKIELASYHQDLTMLFVVGTFPFKMILLCQSRLLGWL